MDETVSVPLVPRQHFFGNAAALNPKLSPDGRWLSWIAPVDGVMNVWLAPTSDLSAGRPITREARPVYRHCFARTNAHVLFFKDQDGDENFHMWCIGFNDEHARDLTPYGDALTFLFGFHYSDPHLVAVGLNDRDPAWHDLYLIDILTGKRLLIHENTEEIASYLLDGALNLRLAMSTKDKRGGAAILKWNGQSFDEMLDIPFEDAMLTEPLQFTRSGDAFFLRTSIGRDTAALTRVDWGTGNAKLIAEHPKADVLMYIDDPCTGEIAAAWAEYIKPEWIDIDRSYGDDLRFLAHEIDGTIDVESMSETGLWIVAADRPDRPFTYHLYDRNRRAVTKLFSARPALEGIPLGQMQGHLIKSRDGLDLICYLTLPPGETVPPERPLPTILEVHGGPWSRDSWRYNRWVQWYSNRGYAVLQVNYRGSTGFGKAFTSAGDREWGGKMHDDLIDAVAWAVDLGIADPKRVAICGASYGGFAAFVGATFTPDVFCCSVPIVGITDLETMLGDPPPYWATFYETQCARVGDPRTALGRSLLKSRSPLHRACNITKPMLIGHGANDVRCKIKESDQIVQAMQERGIPVTYVVFPDEGHGFDRPENEIAFNAIMEAFLARNLGGRCEPTGDDFEGSSFEIRAGADIVPTAGVGRN